jgi:SAM-dependent methyltransferase
MTATSDAGYTPAYTLNNQWRSARERLQLLEGVCDPITARNLDRVGVGAGWHCLELGAGAGSVARMLCDRVGPTGRVLAVDLEPALLADVAEPNLEVRRLDVVTDALPEAAFDLIHTRAVLLHIPQRDEVLPKLIRALRPGGVLLLEEMDVTPAFEVPDSLFLRTIQAAWGRMIEAGAAIFWAATVPTILEPAGLVDVGSHRHRLTFTGASPMAEFHRITWAQLLEGQPYTDEERATIAAGDAEVAKPGGEYTAWDVVAAWGRRPT